MLVWKVDLNIKLKKRGNDMNKLVEAMKSYLSVGQVVATWEWYMKKAGVKRYEYNKNIKEDEVFLIESIPSAIRLRYFNLNNDSFTIKINTYDKKKINDITIYINSFKAYDSKYGDEYKLIPIIEKHKLLFDALQERSEFIKTKREKVAN